MDRRSGGSLRQQGRLQSKSKPGGYMASERRSGMAQCADPEHKYKVVYHKQNDFSNMASYNINPNDFRSAPGQGASGSNYNRSDLEREYSYGNWTQTIFPSADDNIARGMAHALALVMQVAAHGPKSVDHEKSWPGMQFLSTVKNEYGELPPNILGFMEHVDFHTRSDNATKYEPILHPES